VASVIKDGVTIARTGMEKYISWQQIEIMFIFCFW